MRRTSNSPTMATSTAPDALLPLTSPHLTSVETDDSREKAMATVPTATAAGLDDEGTSATMKQQHQQRDEEETANNPKKKSKKTLRPRLQPISCKDDDGDDDDIDIMNSDNPSLSVTCAHDLGFGSFVVTVPSASTLNKEKKNDDDLGDDRNEMIGKNHVAKNNKNDAAINYKEVVAENSEVVMENSAATLETETTSITTAPAVTAPSAKMQPAYPQQQLRRHPHATRLQPKSIIFSSPNESGNSIIPPSSPNTPGYDDDGYGAFGFGLISASKEEKNTFNYNSAAMESSVSEVEDLGEEDEGGETTDTTLDNSTPSPRIASRVQRGSGRRGGGGKHIDRISSISLSRVMSADSYISDDSTSSSSSAGDEESRHHHRHQQQQRHQRRHSPSNNDAYFNRRELLRHGSSLSSSNNTANNNFPVLSRKNSIHTQTSSRSLTMHLMSSDRGDDDGTCNGDSIISFADSFIAVPSSDVESYFGQSRVSHEQPHQQLRGHQGQQPRLVAYPRQSSANDSTTGKVSQGGVIPLQEKSSRQLIEHTHPAPAPDDDVIELILSNSEESGERKLLRPTTTVQKVNHTNLYSEVGIEGINNESGANAHQQQQLRAESLTPASIDDPLISNELRSYYSQSQDSFRRISYTGTDSMSPSPPPPFSPSCSSGRHPPIRNRHVESVIAHYRNDNNDVMIDEGQVKDHLVVPTNSASHHCDSPFLTNLKNINSQASYGSVIHSLQGGIATSEDEIEDQQRSRYGLSAQSKPPISLAHSDFDYRIEDITIAGERAMKSKVYPSRWIMLMYMSVLNMLSGWTCFSIAPFSELAEDILGISPDNPVATFFAANFIASVFEPMILRRLGLRRSVLLGALLLMTGNMLKGGTLGSANMEKIDGRRACLGFIFAGMSGPLYQNTPAILISSWFPSKERRIATDIVMCSNQLGIMFSFIFGSWLVRGNDDVLPYFHSLGLISMVVFVGVAMQFSDCPPTPPSGMARVIRGRVERPIVAVVKLAPPSPFNEANAEYGTLLPVPSQNILQTTLLSYGSTEPTTARSSLSANGQDVQLFTNERKCDVGDVSAAIPTQRVDDEPPNEAMSVHPGLEFYPCDVGLNFQPKDYLPPTADDGAEPIITQTVHVNIDVCDDQLWRALRACCTRDGFLPCISAFATSRIVVNSLSTFICYFTTDVGVVGGAFHLAVLASSVMCRKMSGESRLYYMIIGLVALASLSLALCGANFDSEVSMTLYLLMAASFVGPLQPLSTKLG